MFRLEYLAPIMVFGLAFASAIESNFYRTEPCSKIHGYCVLESECPHPVDEASKSLCLAGDVGAVCCKDFPAKEVNCFQTHNECRNDCPQPLTIGKKGCPDNQVCCVLV